MKKHRWHIYSPSEQVLSEIDYTYDNAGNRLTRNVVTTTNDTRDQKYTYSAHRLHQAQGGTYNTGTGAIDNPNFGENYSPDALGNWKYYRRGTNIGSWTLIQDRKHNLVNEIDTDNDDTNDPGGGAFVTTTGVDWVDPLHDKAGNMTRMPMPASPTSGLELKYDAWNRFVEVKQGGSLVQQNEYDGLGRRIVRLEYVSGSLENTFGYYYNDQWQLLTEVKNGTDKSIYQWHPNYIDALAVRMRADDTYFFLHDANFNVVAAVDDSDNAVDERYSYTPYGEVIFLNPNYSTAGTQSIIDNQHLYTGRERDPETGLQFNRHRFYASHLGRWVTRDPIEYRGSKWNLYEYIEGRPLTLLDPQGTNDLHIDKSCCGHEMGIAVWRENGTYIWPPKCDKTYQADGWAFPIGGRGCKQSNDCWTTITCTVGPGGAVSYRESTRCGLLGVGRSGNGNPFNPCNHPAPWWGPCHGNDACTLVQPTLPCGVILFPCTLARPREAP